MLVKFIHRQIHPQTDTAGTRTGAGAAAHLLVSAPVSAVEQQCGLTCKGGPGGRGTRRGRPHEDICQLQAGEAALQRVSCVIHQVAVGVL